MKDIGKRIREIRKSKKISMQVLANEIGVAVQTIQKYETGIIKEIPLSQLEKIAQVLDVQINELLGYKKEKSKSFIYNDFIDFIETNNIELNENNKIELINLINNEDYSTIKLYCDFFNIKFPFNENSFYLDVLFMCFFLNIISFKDYFKNFIFESKIPKIFDNSLNIMEFHDDYFEFNNYIENCFYISKEDKTRELQRKILRFIKENGEKNNKNNLEDYILDFLNKLFTLNINNLEKVKDFIEFLDSKSKNNAK